MPWHVPSDSDVEAQSSEALFGRWTILVDLYGEFQGAALLSTALTVLAPALLLSGVYFSWFPEDGKIWALTGAGVLFVIFATIAAHSWSWLVWIRRRERRVFQLMHREADE